SRGGAPGPRRATAEASPSPAVHARRPSALRGNDVRVGSAIATAVVDGRTIAYAADEDDRSLHVFDVDAQKEIGALDLGAAPGQLLVLGDGRIAVALRGGSEVVFVDVGG